MDRSNGAHANGSISGSATAGADFLQLDIGQAPPGGRTDWLAARLRQAITDGRLPVGSRLPATRVLAAELRVSRGVVTEAYRRLGEDGQIAGRGRGGTIVVAAPLTAPAPPTPNHPAVGARSPFPATPGTDAFDVLRTAPARIDLSPGLPDVAAFPRAAWLRAERAVLAGLTPCAFGYADPRGAVELRRAVADRLARYRGFRAGPDQVLITAGTAQALGLLAQALSADGIRQVAVEDPGSMGARQHLAHWGMDTPPVAVDEQGVDVAALRACGAPAVLLTPAHQFPSGVVLGGERRRALLGWAAEGGLVIEDDYDAEHRYDRPPVPALRSMLAERVCYTGSVSKLLAPALRTGWLLVPSAHRDAVIEAKRCTDLGNAALPQLVLAHLMESGELERQSRLLRRRHRARRDAMVRAVAKSLPGAVVQGAAAGLHLTVTFAAGFCDTELAAAALERGVKVQPLSWHRQRPGPPGLVLGYAATPSTAITEGVAHIGRALRAL
ncbi:PLP-dependent aminotransferase family protein [Streptomyces orinoci]|uniref:PLP-dependent aminotransferase family protein n=1 Tax=Streptomyces orinoci TaxID=67339 RepID=A0ABV3JQG0_STRON|nr:PLP-dependent aminotransferase family protein [Streptomyces orinoci]